MTFAQQIKSLRDQHRHEEAYQLTLKAVTGQPEDLWNRRFHAWSIYYLIKKHTQAGQSAQALRYLQEYQKMNLPQEETLLHERMGYFVRILAENHLKVKELVDQGQFWEAFQVHSADDSVSAEALAWTVFYLVRAAIKEERISREVVFEVLGTMSEKVQPDGKLVYKLILQQLIKAPESWWDGHSLTNWVDYLGGFGILEGEDFQKTEFEGRKLICLAERLHIAYSKALLREKADSSRIQTYLDQVVSPLLEPHQHMLYVSYFKAKLLLSSGSREEGLKAFLPFAKKKSGEFWVWQVMAEAHQDQPELYLACLCKAMTCKTSAEFLSGIRERLIAHLIEAKEYDWAKTELDQLVAVREKMGWGLRGNHRQLLGSKWYGEAVQVDQKSRYVKLIHEAEALLGIQQQTVLVLVTGWQEDKQVMQFVTAEGKSGWAGIRQKVRVGELYLFRGEVKEESRSRCERLDPAGEHAERGKFFREVSGQLVQRVGQDFGFVSGVFVEPRWIKQLGLKSGDRVKGEAKLSPVKGKKEAGWKMIKLERE